MQWWFALIVAGCDFDHGMLPSNNTQPDAPRIVDAAADAVAATCYQRWHDGTIRFATPTALTEIDSTTYDRDPSLSSDGLTFYVSSSRTGTLGGADIFQATRASISAAFGMPATIPPVSSTGTESKFSITTDGLYGVVGSDRTGSLGSIDVWETSRALPLAGWSLPVQTHLAAVNTYGADHDPTISGDGLRLYLAPANGIQTLEVASRATRDDNFGTPAPIDALNSPYGDGDPSLSPDELIILFSSNRPTSTLNGNIWYSVRDTLMSTWRAPAPLADLNSDVSEGDATLSSDGCRVYFARDGGNGNWDIYVATAL